MNDRTEPRRWRRCTIIVPMVALLLAGSYAALHARELRCSFVACSDLRRSGERLYADPAMPAALEDRIRRIGL